MMSSLSNLYSISFSSSPTLLLFLSISGIAISKHISKSLVVLYIIAEIKGALLGFLFVKYVIGTAI